MKMYNRNSTRTAKPAPQQGVAAPKEPEKGSVKVDGFMQVLDLLKIADPAFRESLLRRLAAHDPQLARNLRENLARAL